ncbi:MAG: hypothetical protein HY606_04460 [Planctomycetes bacterium]|nr:hypothetical protein [Planctomycetota bacterium]
MDETPIAVLPDNPEPQNFTPKYIRINLIPPEKRVVRRTPPVIFMLFVISIGIFVGSLLTGWKLLSSIDAEQKRSENIVKRISEISDKITLYETTNQEISRIESSLTKYDPILKRDYYLSDLLKSIVESVSSVDGIRIEKISLLKRDAFSQEKLSGYKYGLEFKGFCDSCNKDGTISTTPLEQLKKGLLGNPNIKMLTPKVTNTDPYKIVKSSGSHGSTLEYTFVIVVK